MDPSMVEILVHIAASSTAKDDARYRALARSYLNFVPATRLELEDPPEDEVIPTVGVWNERMGMEDKCDSQMINELRANVEEDDASYQPGPEEEGEVEDDDISEALPTPSVSQEHPSSRRMSSAELSFQSAANNADSPTFRYRGITCAQLPPPAQPQIESQKSTDSYKPPRSTISDSQPEYNKPSQVQASPIRALEYLLQRQEHPKSKSQESPRSQRQRSRNEAASRISESQKSSSSDIRDFAFLGTSSSAEQASLSPKANKLATRPQGTIPGTPTPIETSKSLSDSVSPSRKMLPPSEIHISYKLRSGRAPRGMLSTSAKSVSQTVPKNTTIPESSEYRSDVSKGISHVPKKTTIPDSFEHTESTSSKAPFTATKKTTIPESIEYVESTPSTSSIPSSVPTKTTIPESSEHLETLSMSKAALIVKSSASLTSSTTNVANPPSNTPSPVSDIITIPRKSLRNIPRTPYRAMKTVGDSSVALKRKLAEKSIGVEVPDCTADSPSVIPETVIRPTKRTKFTLTRPTSAPSISRSHTERATSTPSTPSIMEQANSPRPAKAPSTPTAMEPDTHPQAESTPTKVKEPANAVLRTGQSTSLGSSPPGSSQLPTGTHLQAESTPTKAKEAANVTPRRDRSTPLFSSPPGPGQLPTFTHEVEIYPPPPATGHDPIDPKSFITPALHALAAKTPLAKFYLPEWQKREILEWDRGYWSIKTAGWDQAIKETCWNFLANFIKQKKGGWTIWCTREKDWSEIMVRCWGVSVPHVYLLLFVASENKIRKVDTCWMSYAESPGPIPDPNAVMVPLIQMPIKK